MEQWQSLADLPRKNSVSPSHRELTSGGGLKGTGQIRVTCSIFRAGFETPGINHDHWQHIRSQRILDVNCQETFLLLKIDSKDYLKKVKEKEPWSMGPPATILCNLHWLCKLLEEEEPVWPNFVQGWRDAGCRDELPGPVAKTSFNTHVKAIAQVLQRVTEAKMQKAVKEIRAINRVEEGKTANIAVSCDGTWARRGF